MYRHHSLRTKLLLAFAALGLGPLAFMGFFAWQVVLLTHGQDVATMESQLLSQKSEELNRFLSEASGLFDIKVAYGQKSIISQNDQQFLLQQLLADNKYILQASFADLTGMETSKNSRLQDPKLAVLNNLSQLQSFKAAKAGKKYYSPVRLTLQGPAITISGPVVNRSGEVVMVLTGLVSLGPLQSSVTYSALGSSGYIYVVDHDGIVVAAANKSFIGRNVAGSPWVRSLLSGIRHSGLDPGDDRTGLLGEEVIAAGTPLRQLNWAAVAEWPRADAFSVVSDIQNQVMLFSLIILVVVLLLGWLVGRRILLPIASLRQGALKIGGGDFGYKLNIETDDEIQDLGEVLNAMGENLKHLDELKQAEIRERSLAEALRREKELSRIKEELLRNASHQLRTPLSIAKWNYQLMSRTSTLSEEQPLKENLGAGISQLEMIIGDLIIVSELGVNFKNISAAKVNLPEMIQKAVNARKKIIAQKKLVWQQQLGDVPPVTGDPLYLARVLENLFDNAITYARGGGFVTVNLAAAGGYIHFTVSDDGIGIPEKEQDLIFGQFFRASNAIDMKNVGTGLGLFICKSIIEGHGGKIWFESKEGRGTTVHFTLPIS